MVVSHSENAYPGVQPSVSIYLLSICENGSSDKREGGDRKRGSIPPEITGLQNLNRKIFGGLRERWEG